MKTVNMFRYKTLQPVYFPIFQANAYQNKFVLSFTYNNDTTKRTQNLPPHRSALMALALA